MSAYDNKYWSHRIAQLAEKVPETDDLSFFTSEVYRDFTEQGVKDLICGTCTYLRTLGYDISEAQEKERISDMVVTMSTDKNMTACTNGDSMIIGVNNPLVKYFPNRELRHYAIQGLRVHETAHVLFTDFKTIDMWQAALSNGNWWPVVPDHAQDPEGAELTQVLSKKEFSKSFAAIAGRLENAIEDGFIEREIKEMYKGLATTELCTTNDAQLSMASTFGEFLKAGRSAYSAMFQQVLMYAKYDITMVDDMPEQYSDVFDACMEVVDDVKCERDAKKRLCGVNEICCILYPLFKEMLTEESEKQNQQSSGSGNGKPGNGNGGSGSSQNSQGQQNGNSGSQGGSGGSQSNSGNGNGNGNGGSGSSQNSQGQQNGNSGSQGGSGGSQSNSGNGNGNGNGGSGSSQNSQGQQNGNSGSQGGSGGSQSNSGNGNGNGNGGSGSSQNSQGQQNGNSGSQGGSSDSQNNSGNGNGNGNGVGSMTAEQLSEALKEAVKQIKQAAKNVGVNNLPDRHNNSITSQAGKNEDAKKRERSKQGSDNANGKSNGDSIANAPGANSGKSDLSAAKCDIEAIERERKRNVATAQANNEANDKLRQEGKEVGREIGTNIYVRRAAEVPQSNIETYNRLSAGLLSITKNLERRLKTTIRDEENDDTVAGLPMGSRVEARLAYHQDGKIFSRKNFPRDNPRLAVGYLCDESGSMSKTAISASVRTAIILQDLCERMELPCYICGFTTEDLKGVDIITYVDMNVDGKDKYRTTGMASRGGTPTVPAMKYMGKKLLKDSTEKKILIVSTDGCSGRGYGETVRDVIKKLQHDGVMVIGAGIGDSKPRIQEEFGDNFLDISNLDEMPKILCNIVKKNLV
jgi:hypothetical protein